MHDHAFFQRAGEESQRYGEDPWVFLRELVQNSRDANARRIEFSTKVGPSSETLICRDDGSGMSQDQIEQYFLRLYASSKEDEHSAIGFFGVGFWSVFLFRPRLIRVSSQRDQRACAFEIDCGSQEIRSIEPTRSVSGTEISLIRDISAEGDRGGSLASQVREKLIHYAAHVRPLPGEGTVELFCNGEKLNRSFSLPEGLGRRFRTRYFDGVLGFGPTPYVRLYKGGILVRDLTSLDELIPSRRTRLPRLGWGLHPSVAINADGMQLLMNRRIVHEDPILHEAVRFCETELLKLHHRKLKNVLPMNLKNLGLSYGERIKKSGLWCWFLLAALLAMITPLLLITLGYIDAPRLRFLAERALAPFERSIAATALPLDYGFDDWEGSSFGRRTEEGPGWDFSYQGPDGLLFRTRTFPEYDPNRGFMPEPHRLEPYSAFAEHGADWLSATMRVSGTKSFVTLPMPSGYALIKGSLARSDGRPIQAWENQFDEPVIRLSQPGWLTYAMTKRGELSSLPRAHVAASPSWPDTIRSLLESLRQEEVEYRVRLLAGLVSHRFVYSQDSNLAASFHAAPGTWLERALALRAGDCDMLNGVLVLLLRTAGIPAYLSIGVVGEGGVVRPGLHAWTRYYDHGWHVVDVSSLMASSSALISHDGALMPGGRPRLVWPIQRRRFRALRRERGNRIWRSLREDHGQPLLFGFRDTFRCSSCFRLLFFLSG